MQSKPLMTVDAALAEAKAPARAHVEGVPCYDQDARHAVGVVLSRLRLERFGVGLSALVLAALLPGCISYCEAPGRYPAPIVIGPGVQVSPTPLNALPPDDAPTHLEPIPRASVGPGPERPGPVYRDAPPPTPGTKLDAPAIRLDAPTLDVSPPAPPAAAETGRPTSGWLPVPNLAPGRSRRSAAKPVRES